MKKRLIPALVTLLLLCACTNTAPPAESDEPTPPTESAAPLVLPWSVPPEEAAPSYDEYFASLVDYGYDDVNVRMNMITTFPVVCTEEGDYQVVWEDGVLYLDTYPGGGREGQRLGEIGRISSARVVLYDTRWIYLVVDGKELLRMDYRGERRTVLFTDESGLMDRIMGDNFVLADGKVMYLAAGLPGGGAGYYRLYIPEERADLLYAYSEEELDALCFPVFWGTEARPAAERISAPYPISNHEFEWNNRRPEFYELYGRLLEASEAVERYFSYGWDQAEIESHMEADYRIAHVTLHYGNILTNEHLSLDAAWTMLSGGSETPAWFKRYRQWCGLSPLFAVPGPS